MPPAVPPRDTPAGAPPRQAIIRGIAVSIGEFGRHLATQTDMATAITATEVATVPSRASWSHETAATSTLEPAAESESETGA